MNKQTLSYYLFGLTLTLFQFAGYSAITLPLLALATLLIFNVGVFNRNLKTMPSYMLFLACSILIGLTFLIFRDTNSKSIMAWGQFYFFAFLLLGIDDKSKLIRIIKYFVYAIFVADLVSNILLAMGMMMVSPVTISLPFKLLLFVMVDGWTLLIQGLVRSYV